MFLHWNALSWQSSNFHDQLARPIFNFVGQAGNRLIISNTALNID